MNRPLILTLILLVAVTLCGSNRLVCQIFNSSENSLQQYCDNFTGMVPANCSSDINSVSDSPQMNQLKISGCDPEFVFGSAKRFQQSLRVLDLSYSGYKELMSFDSFDKLQIFNASHNELTYLTWNFFPEFPEIVEIDLSYNRLSRVHYGLKALPKLRRFHLSHNKFDRVDMNNFPLQCIEYIDLNSNQIGCLLFSSQKHFKNLKEFHLAENPYQTVDFGELEGMFHGRLTSLFITWKNVQFFRGLCRDDCQGKRVRIVRINDSRERIFVKSDGTYEIHCNYKCFGNVLIFDAGHNNFQNGNDVIQNIGSHAFGIHLSGNFIGELSASAFHRFTRLHRLGLSETNLTWFDFDMLRSQKDAISHVDISNNNLKELRNIPSLHRYKLLELFIGGNQIKNAYKILGYLSPTIEKLDLSGGNFVGKLNYTTFQRLIGLKQLNLSNTNLIFPNANPFYALQYLEVLDLSHNNLENFSFSIISATLYNLTELNLADCRINDIAVFRKIIPYLGPNLKKLDLSRNAADGAIDSMSFDLNSLKHQRKLTFLDLSNNEFKAVDFKSFSFDEPIHINLEGNDLIELTNLQKRDSETIWTTLNLANNRFPCAYLDQLVNNYVGEISLLGEPWQQKPDRDCRTTIESSNSTACH